MAAASRLGGLGPPLLGALLGSAATLCVVWRCAAARREPASPRKRQRSESATTAESDGEGRKKEEWLYLRDCLSHLQQREAVRRALVAHRGFHCVKDAASRPIENSLPAYETAWSLGCVHAECDVARTRDGHLVLHHDRTLTRLRLVPSAANLVDLAQPRPRPIEEVRLVEILGTPLKDGLRAPLLKEVVEVAALLQDAGRDAKLIVELKPAEALVTARAVADFFASHPRALDVVAVVMSFDAPLLHAFARELAKGGAWEARRPLLLLLTTAQAPEDSEVVFDVGVTPLAELRAQLDLGEGWRLDGAYVEWQEGFTGGPREAALQELVDSMVVGVWKDKDLHPDTLVDVEQLVRQGVRFVNTDFAPGFVAAQDSDDASTASA